MSGKTGSRRASRALRGTVYLDASALAKVYLPEPESDELESALLGRRDLCVSDLSVTEVVSAAARRRREGLLSSKDLARLHTTLLDDLSDQSFLSVGMSPAIHREAERLLLGFAESPLRAADALHLALALAVGARTLVTFDKRLAEAAAARGLHVHP
ncbi:MAG: type II toxin-antitoxin system VapC family toxin [Myxococcota bacterium]